MKSLSIKIRNLLAIFVGISLPLSAFTMPDQREPKLLIHNRPLVKINDKTISLLDVVKRLDVYLHENHPTAFESQSDLYQYYKAQWKTTLKDMIEMECLLVAAVDRQVAVTDGEIREEMEERFGPNIIATLDKMELPYEEATELVKTELLRDRMLWGNAFGKAMRSITPLEVQEKYTAYLSEHPPKKEWTYQVLSVRGGKASECELLAQKAHDQIEGRGLLLVGNTSSAPSLEEVANALEQTPDTGASVNLSQDIVIDDSELSNTYRNILSRLDMGSYSEPIMQTSRRNNEPVYRIFHLKNCEEEEAPTFESRYDALRNGIFQERAMKEKRTYMKKLKEKLSIDKQTYIDLNSNEYVPFELVQ